MYYHAIAYNDLRYNATIFSTVLFKCVGMLSHTDWICLFVCPWGCILCIVILVTVVWYFCTVHFQICPQMACLRKCIITQITLVLLLPYVCFQMSHQIACQRGCKVTLFAFIWLFTTVRYQMCPQMVCIENFHFHTFPFIWGWHC